jgi:U2 small nuclear ribonucleoprotein A'
MNPLNARELELRSSKIPQIENLGATEDLYEVIDLSDNEISRLENLPALSKLAILLLNNNKLNRIALGVGANVPNLHTLIMTNNRFTELSELDPLKEFPSIVTLSLIGNTVQTKPHYRAFLIHKLPHLRVLDFQKVKKQERQEAETLFGSPDGVALAASLAKKTENTFVPGQDVSASSSSGTSSGVSKLTVEQRNKIRKAIETAKSDEELNRLEEALQKGKMPKELL